MFTCFLVSLYKVSPKSNLLFPVRKWRAPHIVAGGAQGEGANRHRGQRTIPTIEYRMLYRWWRSSESDWRQLGVVTIGTSLDLLACFAVPTIDRASFWGQLGAYYRWRIFALVRLIDLVLLIQRLEDCCFPSIVGDRMKAKGGGGVSILRLVVLMEGKLKVDNWTWRAVLYRIFIQYFSQHSGAIHHWRKIDQALEAEQLDELPCYF